MYKIIVRDHFIDLQNRRSQVWFADRMSHILSVSASAGEVVVEMADVIQRDSLAGTMKQFFFPDVAVNVNRIGNDLIVSKPSEAVEIALELAPVYKKVIVRTLIDITPEFRDCLMSSSILPITKDGSGNDVALVRCADVVDMVNNLTQAMALGTTLVSENSSEALTLTLLRVHVQTPVSPPNIAPAPVVAIARDINTVIADDFEKFSMARTGADVLSQLRLNLVTAQDNLRRAMIALNDGVRNSKTLVTADLEKQVQRLRQGTNSAVAGIDFTNAGLRIRTNKVTAEDNGEVRVLGRLQIVIPYTVFGLDGYDSITMTSLDYDYALPHANYRGDVCWGNFAEAICDACSKADLEVLLLLLLQIVCSPDSDDAMGSHFNDFPLEGDE